MKRIKEDEDTITGVEGLVTPPPGIVEQDSPPSLLVGLFSPLLGRCCCYESYYGVLLVVVSETINSLSYFTLYNMLFLFVKKDTKNRHSR